MLRSLFFLPVLLVACGDSQPADAKAPTKAKEASVVSAPSGEPGAEAVVATWSGGQVTYGQIVERLGGELKSMEMQYLMQRYETQSMALDQVLVEALLEAEAKKGGHADIQALLKVEIEDKVAPPTDAEIEAFYPVVARQLGGATLEEAKPMLASELMRRAQSERYQKYLADLQASAGVKKNLPYPDLPRIEVAVDERDPIAGAKDAPVTIVQFAEYQCYYCGRAKPTIDELLKKYEGKVRVVFKDYPLPNHGRAQPAAEAAHCAGDQGKYWEMNSILLDNQQALEDADLAAYAGQLGLDAAAWQKCLDDGKYRAFVQNGLEVGRKAGVSATPTFYVNGLLVSGAQPVERFSEIIDRELTH